MGWMSDLAGKTPHKGQVVVTLKSGVSTAYLNVEKAEEACRGLKGSLTYFRGAFFESGASRRADAAAAPAKAESTKPPAPPAPPTPKPKSRRRGSASADETQADD